MATQHAIISATLEDEKGERVACPFYAVLDDTATLATLITYAKNVSAGIEAVSSSQLVRNRLIIDMTLPSGIKSAPDVGSDNEESGLFTLALGSPNDKSFGFDVPGINPVVMESAHPNVIDQTNAAVMNLVDLLTGGGYNNLWTSTLASVRSAIKTFRKHRRAAKRIR